MFYYWYSIAIQIFETNANKFPKHHWISVNFSLEHRIQVYFGGEIFLKNVPKFLSQKKYFGDHMNKKKGVTWRHFHKINFRDKAKKREICENILSPK